ncbi:hypothetical protein C2869_01540 [Saccharobesus litoralis]|uniref:Histidine phosphatase family protein n=1 Tax=Saccharobesus litoralis TaxID=2172099 RepID=A0A2S0VLY7_9ALTE|nr:histidine phosphatase family protein [Saccharobesus litoralis]AWB65205.1 hypothetical protein C2869_01540 [Saccharobesus litoralis]
MTQTTVLTQQAQAQAQAKPRKIQITLVRHPKVDGAAGLYGATDIAAQPEAAEHLNQQIMLRLSQARQVEQDEQKPAAFERCRLFSSPKKRCLSVAEQVVKQVNCDNENKMQLEVIDDLAEMDFGCYDGVAFESIPADSAKWQELENFWQNPAETVLPQAETLQSFHTRIINAWHKVLAKLQQSECSHALLVVHGGVIRMILSHILDLDWRNAKLYSQLVIDYASFTELSVTVHPDCKPFVRVKAIGTKPTALNNSVLNHSVLGHSELSHSLINKKQGAKGAS